MSRDLRAVFMNGKEGWRRKIDVMVPSSMQNLAGHLDRKLSR